MYLAAAALGRAIQFDEQWVVNPVSINVHHKNALYNH